MTDVNQQPAQSISDTLDRLTYEALFGDNQPAYTGVNAEPGNLGIDDLAQTIEEIRELKRVYYATSEYIRATDDDNDPALYKLSPQIYGKELYLMHPDNYPAFEKGVKDLGLEPVEFDINEAAMRKAKEELSKPFSLRLERAKHLWW